MKSQILKYCELSWEALTHFKAFLGWSTFCKFDVAELTTPSLHIATAVNKQGVPMAFCPIENILLVSYALNPNATKEEAGRAGDAVDTEVAKYAQRLGVSKAMIVLPEGVTIPDDEGETIRVHIRKIPVSPVIGVGLPAPSTAAWLN
jgi:hypothetical protein